LTTPFERHSDVFWGASAAALLVAQQVTGKATRDALFLSHHPAASLPAVMMGSSVVAIGAALVVGRLLSPRAPRQVVPALVGLNAALLLGQFLLASAAPGLAGVLLYLQVAATGGTLLSGYWSVVNERFDPWTAKRVVNRLGFGASLGGILGGALALAASRFVPLITLLPLTAGLNVLAFVCLVRFAGDAPPQGPRRSGDTGPARSLGSMPYLRLLALLVALGAGVEALLDYVLKSSAATALHTGPALVAFFAAYHTGVGILGVLGQTLLTRPALSGLGLARTVAMRPLYVAAAAVVGLVDLRLWSAVLGRAGHDVLSNSLFRSGYELLFTPLPENQKRATKQVVDVAFDKVGALVGGAVTLLAVRLIEAPERALLFLAGGVSLLAVSLTQRLHHGYVETLEEGLRAGQVHVDPDEVVDSTTRFTLALPSLAASSRQPLPVTPAGIADGLLQRIAELRSGDASRIRAALKDETQPFEAALVAHLLPLLGRNDVSLDAFRALRRLLPRAVGQIADAILDPAGDPVVRRRLPRLLKATPGPRAVEALLHGLADPLFPVREACGAALASQAARRVDLGVPATRVFAAVARELEEAALPGPVETKARLAHVFSLLSLNLDRSALRSAERALGGSDASLRGTAFEYLETVLPRDLAAGFLRLAGAPGNAPPQAPKLPRANS
jgi:ATP:ADP antiporter, AAA family